MPEGEESSQPSSFRATYSVRRLLIAISLFAVPLAWLGPSFPILALVLGWYGGSMALLARRRHIVPVVRLWYLAFVGFATLPALTGVRNLGAAVALGVVGALAAVFLGFRWATAKDEANLDDTRFWERRASWQTVVLLLFLLVLWALLSYPRVHT